MRYSILSHTHYRSLPNRVVVDWNGLRIYQNWFYSRGFAPNPDEAATTFP